MRRESEIVSKGFKLIGDTKCETCHLFRSMNAIIEEVDTDICYCAYDAVRIIPTNHEDCPYFKK